MKTKVQVIADSLRDLRIHHRMTRETLSHLCNIPVATLASYETGTSPMTVDDAWALADTFGLAMDEFLGRTSQTQGYPEQERHLEQEQL